MGVRDKRGGTVAAVAPTLTLECVTWSQFMVLDYTLFKPGNALADNLFWVVEQIPGLVQSGDLTWRLRQHGYFGSYTVPQVCAVPQLLTDVYCVVACQ